MENQEILVKKLTKLLYEMDNAKDKVGSSTRMYLLKLEELVKKYLQEINEGKLRLSNGGTLGFRRAIIEYDDLAAIGSLYDAAKDVDICYSRM